MNLKMQVSKLIKIEIDINNIDKYSQQDILQALHFAVLNGHKLEGIKKMIMAISAETFISCHGRNLFEDLFKRKNETNIKLITELIIKLKCIKSYDYALMALDFQVNLKILHSLIGSYYESVYEKIIKNVNQDNQQYYLKVLKFLRENEVVRGCNYIYEKSLKEYFRRESKNIELLEMLVQCGAHSFNTNYNYIKIPGSILGDMNDGKMKFTSKEFELMMLTLLHNKSNHKLIYEDLYDLRENVFKHCDLKVVKQYIELLKKQKLFDYEQLIGDSINCKREIIELI